MATLRSRISLLVLILTAACLPTVSRADDGPTAPPRTLMRLPSWIESMGDDDGSTGIAPETRVETPQGHTQLDLADRVGGRRGAEWGTVTPVAAPATKPVAPPKATPTTSGFRRWINERVATLPKPTEPTASENPAEPPVDQSVTEPQSTVTAPVAVTPDEMPTLSIDPASFRGALPGKTTRQEVEKGWGAGEAFTRGDGTTGLAWTIEPFERVEVGLEGDVVASISIKLAEPVPLGDLARQLEISDLRTVAVKDEQDVRIGEVFPERGVIISVEPGTANATAILIEPLDADSFVLRAEGEIDTCSAYAVADLQYAIQIDPQHIRAQRLLLAMTSDQGKWRQALRLAEAAGRLDPDDVWTKLKHAGVLLALDRPEEARVVLDRATALASSSPLVLAQTARLSGRIHLAQKTPDYQKAVDHFGEAIRRASPLLTKQSPALQAAAREVLLDAHLGTALAIAKGTWQQKSRVIPKWISRADAVIKEFPGDEKERQVLELQLCRGAIAVSAGSTEAIEPLPWVKRLLELRDRMGDGIGDPWRRRQLDWDVGQALADALTAAQKRGDATDMLDNATLTAAYLERGSEHRELTAAERKSLGELNFRIGIMHSLQRGDHPTAVTWFDRTIPLWDDNDRFDREGELGRLGESYVSMAISYWQVGRREDAVTLSRRGVDLMVAAVDKSQLEERALAVAYGNLATMYAEQGDDQQSKNYAEMASRAEATGTIR
ncbi:MAG: tetratricopeptide repeat protein [Planctomycetes bacterium]|nr:tetratricopeptide repeat protein [Planctomycetota bacterium]